MNKKNVEKINLVIFGRKFKVKLTYYSNNGISGVVYRMIGYDKSLSCNEKNHEQAIRTFETMFNEKEKNKLFRKNDVRPEAQNFVVFEMPDGECYFAVNSSA